MTPPPHARSYSIQKDGTENVPIRIAEARVEAENLPLTTWSASFLLSNVLHTLKIDSSKLKESGEDEYSIVELGAGTGLTGLSAAVIWGANSLLTDLPGIVPGLQMNIDLNSDLLKKNRAIVSCGSLDWNSPDVAYISNSDGTTQTLTTDKGFSIVIAADTMYTEDHPRLLSKSIAKCLRRAPHARTIICYPMRLAYMEYTREFWELMEQEGLEPEQEGREEIDLTNWDDERLHEWSVWKWKDL